MGFDLQLGTQQSMGFDLQLGVGFDLHWASNTLMELLVKPTVPCGT